MLEKLFSPLLDPLPRSRLTTKHCLFPKTAKKPSLFGWYLSCVIVKPIPTDFNKIYTLSVLI